MSLDSEKEGLPGSKSLRDRTLIAGFWTLGGYGSDFAIRIASNLILSRLLFPEAFGAIAAASALIVGFGLISDFGVRAVIMQSPRGEEVMFLRSAWVFQIWRGLLLWFAIVGVCAIIALPSIQNLFAEASIFRDAQFPAITAVLGFSLVLAGAESTTIALNQRRLNYRYLTIIALISKVAALVVMILTSFLYRNAWSLVFGSLAASIVRLVLSHTLVPGPSMKLEWSAADHREILQFGRWIVVSSIATFFSQQSDILVLGLMLPAGELGLYSIAKLLVGAGEGLLDQLNGSLTLPVLSEVIRKNPSALKNRYYRFRLPIDLAAGLMSGCLFSAGAFIVGFLYDARYLQAGLMLQILAVGTVLYPFGLIGGAFTATGETYLNAIVSVSKAVSLLLAMSLGFLVAGLSGAVGGIALHRVVPSLVAMSIAYRRNWISVLSELRVFLAFGIGIIAGKCLVLIMTNFGLANIRQLMPRRI